MQITRTFSIILLAAFAGACSSSSGSSEDPVIDNVDVPGTASLQTVTTSSGTTEQAYVISGTMNFHDVNNDLIQSFTVHIVSPTSPNYIVSDSTTPITNGPVASGPAALTLGFPTGGPYVSGATVTYDITITSVAGKVSAPVTETLALQ